MAGNTDNARIGAFVVGALLLAAVSLVIATGANWNRDTETVVMVFDGSVKGLTVGAPVAFRGVEVGSVTDIDLILNPDSVEINLLVEARIDGQNLSYDRSEGYTITHELIERGMRAQLNTQSLLTGLLYVQLDFHPGKPLHLAQIDSPLLQIPTIPSDLDQLAQDLESVDLPMIAADARKTLTAINRFVSEPAFQNLPADINQTLTTVNNLGQRLDRTLAELEPNLQQLVSSATSTMETLDSEVPQLTASTEQALGQLERAVDEMSTTLRSIDYVLSDDSPTLYRLNEAIQEVAGAGRALQLLAKSLEAQPEVLIRGRSGE